MLCASFFRFDLHAAVEATTSRRMTAASKSDRQDTQTKNPARSAGMSRRLVIIRARLLFVLACATVFWLSERQARQMKVGFPHFSEQTFTLIDQTGVSRTNNDFAGAPIALFFGYSYCPNVYFQ